MYFTDKTNSPFFILRLLLLSQHVSIFVNRWSMFYFSGHYAACKEIVTFVALKRNRVCYERCESE